ncbi:hypothetical protein ABB37_00684 [Leptomonas pyrrhocoris]|uniref:Uncharacterized protein n=1 Tax=Leptomonas pyrrhocoris TaxID=157538 RepID=A0A0N0VI44_LEPPY|nr:hypothetical protein ABB37_00684 [Leptomonas pyrrhocoris]KPA86544.1 hypothetical protein ABB37_00684 [Leptomonas pyrrhocoris]|eukprot:XP_015664983.1 hypothetical protein ABB37_00684 [Leptomonas pyrrhocoris]
MSASSVDLTAPEAYALWGERIHCLFAAPPSFIDATVDYNPFERHACSVPLPPPSPQHDESPSSGEGSRADATSDSTPSGSSRFFDESLYPLCFYARLLQSSKMPNLAAPASVNATGHKEEDGLCTEQQIQHLLVDDDELARRLAGRLRARNREQIVHLQRQRAFESGSLVSAFCDPKVEQQQALLHSELTEFLLSVRAENKAAVALRRQLQRSRMVRETGHDAGLPSTAFIPRDEH